MDLEQAASLSAPAAGHTRFGANDDGTLRYYPDGGSELTVSDTTHTHTIAEGTLNTTENYPYNSTGNNTYEQLATNTFTPQGAKHVTVHTAIYATSVSGSFSGTGYLRLLKAGVQTVVRSRSIGTGGTYGFVATDVYIEPAASSTAFSAEGKANGSGTPFVFIGGGQSVQEVQCE